MTMTPLYIPTEGPGFVFGTHDIPTAVAVMRGNETVREDLEIQADMAGLDAETVVDAVSTAVWLAGPDDADPADWCQVGPGTPGAVPALILERL
jgi:hypothetical protein